LTRDVVDGFGPTSTDGAFTIAAETTMEVLRANTNTLITVLSAVVSDPLYSWSVSPVKARQREDESIFAKENSEMPALAIMSENDNDVATRTIAKINEKLHGYEEGTFGEMQTIEGQVRLLINAARNPDNLCNLYYGWMPWL
jgi:serine-protein kinase ATM